MPEGSPEVGSESFLLSTLEWIQGVPPMDPLWPTLVLALLAVVLGVRAARRIRDLRAQLRELRREQQRLNTSVLALHGAMKVIAEDVINHSQHQSSVKRALERLADQQSELRLRDVDEGLYGQAIELIRHGRGRDEVRQLCALTAAEVDLLFSLHGTSAMRDPRPTTRG